MKKLLISSIAVGALFLAGCTSNVDDPPATESTPPATVEPTTQAPVDPVIESVAETDHRWVQDLWVYETVSKIDASGQTIDLTEQILTELAAGTGEEHTLPGGGTFVVHPSLSPTLTDIDGAVRTDVDVLAGVLVDGDSRGLAILATPQPDADAPIGLADQVELDLTFVDELNPGDPMFVNFAFLQTTTGAAPTDLTPMQLLSHRLENGQAQYYGDAEDVGLFEMHLGQAVAGSTRLQMPAKSDPMMGGFRDGVSGCRGGLKCVRDFFKKFGGGAADSNKLINCNLGSCNDSPPPVPKVTCVKRKCTVVHGDPHVTNLDGRAFDMQGVGEFVGLRGDDLEVQIRTEAWSQSRTVSVLSAVAVQADGATIMIDSPGGGLRVHVDGQPQELGEVGTATAVGSMSLETFHRALQVTTSTGRTVTVTTTGSGPSLGLQISLAEDDDVLGMLAGSSGDSDAPLLMRDGTVLADPIDNRAFYDTFVNSWRVSTEESAFTYEGALSTADFTDLTFPDTIVTLDSLPAEDRIRALAICAKAGIVSRQILAQCVFDYAATGSVEFVKGARTADIIDGVASGRLEAAPSPAPTPVDPATVRSLWQATASGLSVGSVEDYQCPAGGTFSAVWGGNDGIYTADSSVCTAAVHQGVITVEGGGTVEIERTGGLDTYGVGSTRNGVTTSDWDKAWSGSYIINPQAK